MKRNRRQIISIPILPKASEIRSSIRIQKRFQPQQELKTTYVSYTFASTVLLCNDVPMELLISHKHDYHAGKLWKGGSEESERTNEEVEQKITNLSIDY